MNILTPKDNYNIDTRPDEIKGLNKIADYVRDQESKEKSISNVVTQTIKVNSITDLSIFGDAYSGILCNSTSALSADGSTFPITPSSPPIKQNLGYYLPNPQTSYKLNSIKEIICTATIDTIFNTYGVEPPVAQTSYNVRYTIAIGEFSSGIELYNTGSSSLYDNSPFQLYFTFVMSYDKTNNLFSFGTDTQTQFLSDTYERVWDTSGYFYDWTVDPSRISSFWFNYLTQNKINLYIEPSFDEDESTALTGVTLDTWRTTPSNSNKAHFEFWFGATSTSTFAGDFYNAGLLVQPYLTFTYFGLLSPYTPNS
jgi:hypothetical protein